MSQEE